MWQPDGSEVVDPSFLAIPLAAATCRYLANACQEIAEILECRRSVDGRMEILSFVLNVEVPQRPVYAILPREIVSVCFVEGRDLPPGVMVTRADFPDTPHQNMVMEGFPWMLCIDDRPWQDVHAGYTASELVTRIRQWFSKAVEGELHGDDQPFDPFFGYSSPHQIILTRDGIAALDAHEKLDVWKADETGRSLLVTSAAADGFDQRALNVHVFQVDVAPTMMKRIRNAPRTLAGIFSFLQERDPSSLDRLQSSVLRWLDDGKRDDDKKWLFCVLARFPQIHPRTGLVGETKPMAFLSNVSPGQIGIELGILDRNTSGLSSEVRYLKRLFPMVQVEGLRSIEVQVAPVHVEMDARAAARLTGHDDADARRVVLIGAGSLGSAIGETLTREGLFKWTIVDDDALLPHNIPRHVLTREHVGRAKAPCLARHLSTIREDASASSIVENVLRDKLSDELYSALDAAQLIIDTSASVPVSRFLSDRKGSARRLCAFFTPDGRSAVLMVEAADRSVRIRSLEAIYLREVMTNPSLESHFGTGQQMRYTGACRALTSRIPTSGVAVLAGLISSGMSKSISRAEPVLKIWTVQPDLSVASCSPAPVVENRELGAWTVLIPTTLRTELAARRRASLPNETGGPLLGLVDYEARVITAVYAPTSPRDSIEKPSTFVRGTLGLRRSIEAAQRRSGGQIRYIGEWHSHPPGASAVPSAIDVGQIYDISLITDIDGYPALSLIVSEDDLGILVGSVS